MACLILLQYKLIFLSYVDVWLNEFTTLDPKPLVTPRNTGALNTKIHNMNVVIVPPPLTGVATTKVCLCFIRQRIVGFINGVNSQWRVTMNVRKLYNVIPCLSVHGGSLFWGTVGATICLEVIYFYGCCYSYTLISRCTPIFYFF